MMSVRKMIELYVTHELSEDTWNMMREMTYHNLISNDNWYMFFHTCKDWHKNDDDSAILDGNGEVIYLRDIVGFFISVRKVAK